MENCLVNDCFEKQNKKYIKIYFLNFSFVLYDSAQNYDKKFVYFVF